MCPVLGNYAAYSDNSLPNFQYNLLVTSSRVKSPRKKLVTFVCGLYKEECGL
jgi:hypothetical protein